MSSPTTLAERFAALKEDPTNMRSELVTVRTPLPVLLELYNKSSHDCYIDYMEGFKLLLDWLCPTAEQLYIPSYPSIKNVPALFGGYETSAVATMLSTKLLGRKYTNQHLTTHLKIRVAMYVYCAKSIPKDYLY